MGPFKKKIKVLEGTYATNPDINEPVWTEIVL